MGIIQTVKEKLMPIFFFALAIYTMYTLIKSAAEVSREKLNLSVEPPSSRCVPFFDNVKTWAEDHVNDSQVLYDYMAGQAIVRICTNESRFNVTSDITGFDKAEAYTPFEQDGCPRSQWRAKIGDRSNNGCVRIGAATQQYSCNELLNWQPCDASCTSTNPPPAECSAVGGTCQGFGYAIDVEVMTGNYTNSTTGRTGPYPKCTIRFELLEGLPKCDGTWVGIFHTPGKNLKIFLWCVVAVPFIVLFAQLYMLYKFDPAPPFDDDYYVSFAMRGIPGPVYQFWWIFIAKRGKFPQAKLRLPAFLACATQDAIEGLAAPIVAIYGCQLSRFPIPLALLSMKIIKFLIDLVLYFKDDSDDNDNDSYKNQPGLDATAYAPAGSPSTPYQQPGYQQPGYQQQMPQQQMPQQQMPQQPVVSNTQGGTQYADNTQV